MAKAKTKSVDKEDIVRIALEQAALVGWNVLSLRDVAEAAGVSLSELHTYFEDKNDILTKLGRMVDRTVLENIGEVDFDIPVRDRLFDVLMERFEALNEYRAGFLAVIDSFKYDPKQVVISLPHIGSSMTWMMEVAGVETGGLRGALKVTGLTGIYIYALKVWREDESPDLGKTMAALDQALGRAESVVDFLSV